MDQNTNSQFGFGKKWFWIGIVTTLFNVVGGLVYGIALAIEQNRRKEGAVLIAFALFWFFFTVFFLGPWLIKSGILPNVKLMQVK